MNKLITEVSERSKSDAVGDEVDYQDTLPVNSKELIDYVSGVPSVEFISEEVNRFLNSSEYKLMKLGERYYRMHPDIEQKRRWVIKDQNSQVENTLLHNSRLKHAFLYKLLRQKKNYLFGRPFTISVTGGKDKVDDDFQTYLENKVFTESLRAQLADASVDAGKYGKTWIQVYYDDNAQLHLNFVPGITVKAYWKNNAHTQLSAILRVYQVTNVDDKGSFSQTMRVEFYNATGVYYFDKGSKDDGFKLHNFDATNVFDPDRPNYKPYYQYKERQLDEATGQLVDKLQAGNFNDLGGVPFICIKYNPDELPLIAFIKDLVDDYDEVSSTVSDYLHDVSQSTKVVKGFDGGQKEASTFVKNLAAYNMVFVGDKGDVTSLQSTMDTTAMEAHLTRLKNDIYSNASGLDSSKTDNLGNMSGVGLRYLYSDLNDDCMELWSSIEVALKKICLYYELDLQRDLPADVTGEALQKLKVDFIPNTDNLINESETIANAVASQTILSKKTILENHPWVKDAYEEQKRLDDEKKESEPDETMGFNFDENGNPVNGQQNGQANDNGAETLNGANEPNGNANTQGNEGNANQGA